MVKMQGKATLAPYPLVLIRRDKIAPKQAAASKRDRIGEITQARRCLLARITFKFVH